jgi:energy-coupling factor transporter ATP-binding protein EcfA2
MAQVDKPTDESRTLRRPRFDDLVRTSQVELTALSNAVYAALGYSPSKRAPKHDDVYAFVTRLIEARFWSEIFVERPEIRNILFQLEKGQIVIVSGERGTGKSTALWAAVQELDQSPAGGNGRGGPKTVLAMLDANQYSSDLGTPAQAAATVNRQIYVALKAAGVRDQDGWIAYRYREDRSFETLRDSFAQDGFDPQTTAEWIELGRMTEYVRVREGCNLKFDHASTTDRLRTLLGFIADHEGCEPLIVIDNVDHLKNEVQRECAKALFDIMASDPSRSRIRGAIAVRRENRDAIQASLDTAMRSPDVSIGALSLKHEVFEKPSARLTLEYIDRRFAILREQATINQILRAIDTDKLEPLRQAAIPTTKSIESFFVVLLELISVVLCNAFGLDESTSSADNREFAAAVHQWHNGSLRECGASLASLASDIVQDQTNMYELQPLMREIIDTRSLPRERRRTRLHRVSRSLLYRHLIFWGACDGAPPANVMVFDGTEEQISPPIYFLKLRILQYFAARRGMRAHVGAVHRHLGELGIGPERLDEVLRELASERAPEDSGLIRVPGIGESDAGRLDPDAVVQLLDAGKYLVRELYVKTEYLFWSAVSSPKMRAAVGLRREPEASEIQDEVFRATIAARFVEKHLVAGFRREHPYLTGLTDEWPLERARQRLALYERLFGFGVGRWFLSECCSSMRGFIHTHEEPRAFAEAAAAIDRVQRLGFTLDRIAGRVTRARVSP